MKKLWFANRLKLARADTGYTQVELAKRSRLKPCTISFLECGYRPNPSIDTVMKVSRALGISVSQLIGDI